VAFASPTFRQSTIILQLHSPQPPSSDVISTAISQQTLSVLFFIIPLISLILQRRRRLEIPADLIQRRLLEAHGKSIARQLWNELVRAVLDTVRMGGGGLV
jgi:hypothetical protein